MCSSPIWPSVASLDIFYKTPLGQSVSTLLGEWMEDACPLQPNEIVVTIGGGRWLLPSNYLSLHTHLDCTASHQGALHVAGAIGNVSCITQENNLPLKNDIASRICAMHCLEFAEKGSVLAEWTRILAPQGRLCLVVPASWGTWRFASHTPFGYGSPMRLSEIKTYFTEVGLSICSVEQALWGWPDLNKSLSFMMERLARRWLASWGSVWLIVATKEQPAMIKGKLAYKNTKVPYLVPVLGTPEYFNDLLP